MNSIYAGFEDLFDQVSNIKGSHPEPDSEERVLIWRGPNLMKLGIAIETALGSALLARGVKVGVGLCDGSLSGCVLRSVKQLKPIREWHRICPKCSSTGKTIFSTAGIEVLEFGKYLTPSDILAFRNLVAEMPTGEYFDFEFEGVRIGALALSSTYRYYLGTDPDRVKAADRVKGEYLFSALVTTAVSKRILEEFKPTRIVMLHGTYVEWGPMFKLAVDAGITVTRYMVGYEKDTLFFKNATQTDTKHLYKLSSEAVSELAERKLNDNENSLIRDYFKRRLRGERDRVKLFNRTDQSPEKIKAELGFPAQKPMWCLFPHLSYDSIFFADSVLFQSHSEFLNHVLKIIRDTKDINWIIKVHPAERVHGVAVKTEDIINSFFPELPDNFRVIPSDSEINTYNLLPVLDGVITNHGTIGLEASLMGIPAIVSKHAHYASKGFTIDAGSEEEYLELIRQAPAHKPMTKKQIDMAYRYAYSFLIERQLPFRLIRNENGSLKLNFDSINGIQPGKLPILDFICDRILSGGEFIMSPDLVEVAVQRFKSEQPLGV